MKLDAIHEQISESEASDPPSAELHLLDVLIVLSRRRRFVGVFTLGAALLAGVPAAGMQVSLLIGFVDREGGGFFQEWSGLFVMDGEQGDRVIFHYPRLQAMQGSAETVEALTAPLEQVKLAGAFRALPVKDANDGETVVCFRSYLPAAMRAV